MSIPTIPVEPSWLLQPTHIACQRLLPVAGISCRNPVPGSGAPALHTARLNVFSRPLSPASPPPYRPDSRRLQSGFSVLIDEGPRDQGVVELLPAKSA